jgi:phosphoglycolate phosphatase
MPAKLVVFDWDGTLMDSTGTISRCIRKSCVEAGLLDPGASIADYVIGLGLSDALRHAAPGATDTQVAHLVDRYRHYYKMWGNELVLFDDVDHVIDHLHSAGYVLAVATGKSRLGLEQAFDQSGLGKRFASSRCADECNPKPHPQMLLELMDELGFQPNETVMVGDTTHDIRMAQSAGTWSIGVTTGAHPLDALQAQSPTQIFSCLTDMLPWLREQ